MLDLYTGRAILPDGLRYLTNNPFPVRFGRSPTKLSWRMELVADRTTFIDESQSLNIHNAEPHYGKLTSMHLYAWKLVSSESYKK